ncbi:hypothetical protein Aspvir_010201 [Aspergillus viridinutans]|uniref:Uncharacterized protein n=1 Tax=Aspergillus viridinutans TaxID=75553 RepID=A0A9P3C0Z4_ASPVI|nr:uncharacterized protein Aspvir_010201 [Aspergillus viridinutans]GIK06083.1 hypothetical protein Aspvir_010201 [Aspergillus viridinutans]
MGEEEYRHIKRRFRTDRFHFIRAPPIEKWNQTEDIWKSKWHSDLYLYRTTIPTAGPDTNLEAESHWKFEEVRRGTNFRAEIYVLPEDEGGAPIAAGDRLTFTDGPNDVEGTLSAFYKIRTTVSPRRVEPMMVDVEKPLQYLDLGRRFTVKQDGKLVALGILGYWGR